MRLRRVPQFVLLTQLLSAPLVHAQSPTPTAAEKADEAKRFFEEGEALRIAGHYEAALEAYLKSRALVPRASNTLNAAVCLYELKRYDEALELFEEAFTKYPEDQLPPSVRDSAKATMAEIEPKIARIMVSSNVAGTLAIDARHRGHLPLSSPVRVLPGKHVVRVIHDGYVTYEQTVEVHAGESITVDAVLSPLGTSGRLRVESATMTGAPLIVDGVPIGAVPWEGTLSPGRHVIAAELGDLGTGPTTALVVQGQTILMRLEGKPLGRETRIDVEPSTASLVIDGVTLPAAGFRGRLPIGSHSVEARAEGYLTRRETLVTTPEANAVRIVLQPDPSHPRWSVRAAKVGAVFVELLLGAGLTPSFGAGAESSSIARVEGTSLGWGPTASLVAGYRLSSGFSFFLMGAWLRMAKTVHRTIEDRYTAGTPFVVDIDQTDRLRLSAPMVLGGLGYRFGLGGAWDLDVRLAGGAAFVDASDAASGTAEAGGVTRPIAVQGSGTSIQSVALVIHPAVSVGVTVGRVRTALSIGAAIFATPGRDLPTGETSIANQQGCPVLVANADCARGRYLVNGESSFGRFVAVAPAVAVGWTF